MKFRIAAVILILAAVLGCMAGCNKEENHLIVGKWEAEGSVDTTLGATFEVTADTVVPSTDSLIISSVVPDQSIEASVVYTISDEERSFVVKVVTGDVPIATYTYRFSFFDEDTLLLNDIMYVRVKA